MKVRLFLQETIEEFADNHANGKKHFTNWLTAIKEVEWEEPNHITISLNGNLLGNGSDRVVFDIGGNGRNAFRIICSYRFGLYYKKSNTYKVHLYVNWIGTHEEYNALTEEQKTTISIY
jgi:mRNA interferase HigB